MSNTGLVNGQLVNGIGASYFNGGSVITIRQNVSFISDATNGVELHQNVGVVSTVGDDITIKQDVVYRNTSTVSNDITIRQNVVYVTSVNDDIKLRQRVE